MKTQNIIIVKPQGYCGGVLKAIETAKKTRIQYPDQKITILGNLVHNQYVKKQTSVDTPLEINSEKYPSVASFWLLPFTYSIRYLITQPPITE